MGKGFQLSNNKFFNFEKPIKNQYKTLTMPLTSPHVVVCDQDDQLITDETSVYKFVVVSLEDINGNPQKTFKCVDRATLITADYCNVTTVTFFHNYVKARNLELIKKGATSTKDYHCVDDVDTLLSVTCSDSLVLVPAPNFKTCNHLKDCPFPQMYDYILTDTLKETITHNNIDVVQLRCGQKEFKAFCLDKVTKMFKNEDNTVIESVAIFCGEGCRETEHEKFLAKATKPEEDENCTDKQLPRKVRKELCEDTKGYYLYLPCVTFCDLPPVFVGISPEVLKHCTRKVTGYVCHPRSHTLYAYYDGFALCEHGTWKNHGIKKNVDGIAIYSTLVGIEYLVILASGTTARACQ